MKDNTVPLKLIALLANGEFHSGEQLGETLGMSRAAINKHIQTLRDWGVESRILLIVQTLHSKLRSCVGISLRKVEFHCLRLLLIRLKIMIAQ